MLEKRTARKQAIEHQAVRLATLLERLHNQHRRWSWVRLAAFALALLAGYLAMRSIGGWIGLVILLAGLSLFTLTVAIHRWLGNRLDTFTLWRLRRLEQSARMSLNWTGIPPPASNILPASGCCLEIDLDLTGPRSLHQLLDLGVSQEGSQRLADWLSQSEPQPARTQERSAAVQELSRLSRFRDRLLLNLRLVSKERLRGARLVEWLSIELPGSRLKWLLFFSTAFSLVNFILLVLNLAGVISPLWIVGYGLYLAFYLSTVATVNPFLDSVVELNRELDKFSSLLQFLEKYPYRPGSQLGKLCATYLVPGRRPSKRLRQIRLVTAAAGIRSNPMIGLFLNLALPWDYTFAFLADRLRGQTRELLPAWLETWTELEALCCLADFSWQNPQYTFPGISSTYSEPFHARALGHPLIPVENKVCNDFTFSELGRVVLVTGSNMAGKSTFIKTVGINLCLAYAGGPVDAAELRARPMRLHTCIRISNSIADGFSYFYAEVKCLKRLLEALQDRHPLPLVYFVDEIFRGTNNRERYLGSRAFIRSLAGGAGCGLIATHDLELAKLEEESPLILNFHFEDQVQEGRLAFDYRIKPGPSTTTNALRIMEMEGLPVVKNGTQNSQVIGQ